MNTVVMVLVRSAMMAFLLALLLSTTQVHAWPFKQVCAGVFLRFHPKYHTEVGHEFERLLKEQIEFGAKRLDRERIDSIAQLFELWIHSSGELSDSMKPKIMDLETRLLSDPIGEKMTLKRGNEYPEGVLLGAWNRLRRLKAANPAAYQTLRENCKKMSLEELSIAVAHEPEIKSEFLFNGKFLPAIRDVILADEFPL